MNSPFPRGLTRAWPPWRSWASLAGSSLASLFFLTVSFPAAALAADVPPAPPPAFTSQHLRALPPPFRLLVLPFTNTTGDPAWKDWDQALPSLLRLFLEDAESVSTPRWDPLKAGLDEAGWVEGQPIDLALARKVGHALRADGVVWGTYTLENRQWRFQIQILAPDLSRPPQTLAISLAGPTCVGVPHQLALRLAQHLDRPVAEGDQDRWRRLAARSEIAMNHLARVIALGLREAPKADQERALRDTLAADPLCGIARRNLIQHLMVENRGEEARAQALEFMKLDPDGCSAHLVSAAFASEDGQRDTADREINRALQVHRGCPEAGRVLFMFHAQTNGWATLRPRLEQAVADRPDEPGLRALLACTLVQLDDLGGAAELFDTLSDLPDEADEVEDVALLMVACRLGRTVVAGRLLSRLGPQAAENPFVADVLADRSHRWHFQRFQPDDQPPSLPRPKTFTAEQLQAELERRLAPEERAVVVNPLEVTPETIAEAQRLTRGLTNSVQRALALFGDLSQRARAARPNRAETNAAGDSPASGVARTRLTCHDHARRFVTLARALGLESWMVHIDRDAHGLPGYHDCALLFVNAEQAELGILVDPTWGVWDVRHHAFTVLDDLQAISHHALQAPAGKPDLRRLRAGLKLNPTDLWTRVTYARNLARAGQESVARETLNQLLDEAPDRWDVHVAVAELDLTHQRWNAALAELQRALTLSPSNAVVHAHLSAVYANLEQPERSRQHLESALELDRGEIPSDLRRESPAQLAMLSAIALGQSGGASALDDLRRRAAQGDLAARIGLAKALFDADPPQVEEGMRWLKEAAEQGDAEAQRNYARNLLTLQGPAAAPEAARWFARAAAQGNVPSQFHLGLLLYEGKLVPRDPTAAGQWILLAAQAGYGEARTLRRELQLFLSPTEWAEAQRRAATFQPKEEKPSRL